jgi:hypothetical protein
MRGIELPMQVLSAPLTHWKATDELRRRQEAIKPVLARAAKAAGSTIPLDMAAAAAESE